jgi:hypothetical protein
MLVEQIFYSTFWISTISIIWFCTDWFVHYSQLFGIWENLRLQYTSHIAENKDDFLPDFLYKKSLKTPNKFLKFLLKLVSCPFCLNFWLALIAGFVCKEVIIVGPVYVLSLFILLQIKKMI